MKKKNYRQIRTDGIEQDSKSRKDKKETWLSR